MENTLACSSNVRPGDVSHVKSAIEMYLFLFREKQRRQTSGENERGVLLNKTAQTAQTIYMTTLPVSVCGIIQ